MSKFFQTLALRIVDWFTRPRNIGLKLLGFGVCLLGMALGVDWLGQLDYQDEQRRFAFRFATGDGLPKWMTLAVYGLGALLALVGLGLVLYRFVVEAKQDSRKRAILIEVRGLHSSPDSPAKDADLGAFPKFRQAVTLDFRPKSEAELVDPAFALQKISGLKSNIQTLADGRDPSDIAVAVGGLAAVPALFLVGMLLDDESAVTLYDWQRNAHKWRLLDGIDDGKRLRPVDLSALPADASEVVLTVSLSYLVSQHSVRAAFPDLPIIELSADEVAADRYWSNEKQQAIVVKFRDTVQQLLHTGVTRIHLVLASPASLSIRLGMAYDRRLFPDVLVYQYERSAKPAYPWAFAMPTHGNPTPSLVRTAPSAT